MTEAANAQKAIMNLLLVGCGKMGGALLARWKESGIASIEVIEPAQNKSLECLPENFFPDIIVFAVKPQQLADILPQYKKRFQAKPLYISIAAGKTTAFFKNYLGEDIRIVRAMPNTPALIGMGMTVLFGTAPAADKKTAEALMASVGTTAWVEDETLMDAVTALSGSGPAYVFLFLEALTEAGVAAGLADSLAKALALQTVAGSCELAEAGKDTFEQLRKNVTSPGGTTEAALAVLMKSDALVSLIKEAVTAAIMRSRQWCVRDWAFALAVILPLSLLAVGLSGGSG